MVWKNFPKFAFTTFCPKYSATLTTSLANLTISELSSNPTLTIAPSERVLDTPNRLEKTLASGLELHTS